MKHSSRIIMDYDPTIDNKYMSVAMQAYFKNKLKSKLADLIKEEPKFYSSMQENSAKEADFLDRGVSETLRFNNYIYHEHEVHHRREIEAALQRLVDGSYGYCAATGKPIGIKRLMAAPHALYSIDEQEKKEKYQKLEGQFKSSAIGL